MEEFSLENTKTQEINNLEKEVEKIDEIILELRKFLADISFKKIQNIYQEWKELQNNI